MRYEKKTIVPYHEINTYFIFTCSLTWKREETRRRLTVAGIQIAVEAVATATEECSDGVLACCSGWTAALRLLHTARRALIHICKNTHAIRSIKPLLYRHPATHSSPFLRLATVVTIRQARS